VAGAPGYPFPQIETARLILRRFEQRDFADLLAYRNDPDVERWQGWGFYDSERGQRLLDDLIAAPFGVPARSAQIAFELRSTGRLVGDAMLQLTSDPTVAVIGYTVTPVQQRQGLGLEGVHALLSYAVPLLRLRRVEATTLRDNLASTGLLAALGFKPCAGALAGEQRYALDLPPLDSH
jgi:RimJ/RimL family protein N-acetyltransferase